MATYKQPCVHCGQMLERDSRYCPGCMSASPFGAHCPQCLKPVKQGQAICSGCGRKLHIVCPSCKNTVFIEEKCKICGQSFMVTCSNKRCGQKQFFENQKCTVCGKKIKAKLVLQEGR